MYPYLRMDPAGAGWTFLYIAAQIKNFALPGYIRDGVSALKAAEEGSGLIARRNKSHPGKCQVL